MCCESCGGSVYLGVGSGGQYCRYHVGCMGREDRTRKTAHLYYFVNTGHTPLACRSKQDSWNCLYCLVGLIRPTLMCYGEECESKDAAL